MLLGLRIGTCEVVFKEAELNLNHCSSCQDRRQVISILGLSWPLLRIVC